jgi:hypothetical protein
MIAVGLGTSAGGAAGAWAWGRPGMCWGDKDDYVVRARRSGGTLVAAGLVSALAGTVVLLLTSRDQRSDGRRRARAIGILSGGAAVAGVVALGAVSAASILEWASCNSG